MAEWRTQIEPELCAAFGERELHAVFFTPKDDGGGARNCVAVMIPETPRSQVPAALADALALGARVLFLCNTPVQAARAAKTAVKALDGRYRRIPYERAELGQWLAPNRAN